MISYKNVFYTLGIVLLVFSVLMFFPAIVDLHSESDTSDGFIISGLFGCFLGGLLFFSNRSQEIVLLNVREKTLTVLLLWIALPILSSLPFTLSSIPISFIDCLFEATSALTTTGSTIVYDLRSFSDGFLFWKAILQFFGGIFFILSCLYVFASLKFSYTMAFEDHNHAIGSILSDVRVVAIVYLCISLASCFLLVGSGLSLTDAVCYSFASISSGGSISDNVYNISDVSRRINWTLSLLMFIGGCSVSLINKIISNGISAFNNRQFLCYASGTFILIVLLATHLFFTSVSNASLIECIEKAALIITSSITTTGLTINSPESFGNFVDTILYIVNFFGGCSGSCTGGIKIFRIIIIFLLVKSYFIRLIKTNAVYIPIYGGRRLGEADITSIFSYFACYVILAMIFTVALSFSEMEFGRAVGAVITTMNNNGPFLGLYKATSMQIAALSSFAKSVLIIAMIAGRVEFVPFFLIMLRSFWKR